VKFPDFRLIGRLNPPYKSPSYDMSELKLKFQRGLLSGLLLCGVPALAQESLLSSEAAARSADARDAYTLIEEGDAAYLKRDYKTAVEKYADALSKLPASAKAVKGLRASAVQRFSQASLAQAQALMRTGDRDGARELMSGIEKVDPNNPKVAIFKKKIDDPIRNNPALTPEHTRNIDRVRRLLYEAQGYYDSGQFDRALMTYEDILRIDKYNKAARRGMERVASAKVSYSAVARDQARAELLREVDAEWEQRVFEKEELPGVGEEFGETTPSSDILAKLNTIQIPELTLNSATLEEAIDFLRAMSEQGDTTTLDEQQKGVPFVVQLGDENHPAVQKIRASRISLNVRNVPLSQALKLVTEASGTTYRVDQFAVVLNAEGFSDPTLIRREFKVPPSFLTGPANAKPDGGGDPFADNADEGGLVAKKVSAKEKLQEYEVSFPDGATASYNTNSSILTVRNTEANIRLIEAIVQDVSNNLPVLVEIRTTILDIGQKNLEELGFDTVLGQIGVGENGFLSGGSTGTGLPLTDMVGGGPVTSGLRSGELSNTSDGLDSLLAREAPTSAAGSFSSSSNGFSTSNIQQPTESAGSLRSSGVISLRRIIDGTANEILMRGLSQKKGTDIMVQPAVTTRPGENASIQSVLEFWYPDEYEPPEIPNAVGGGDGIVTPATPTSFISKNLGVSLEVLPQVGPDRRIIEVALNPIVTDFEGFVNYGTPITGSSSTTTLNFVDGTIGTSGAFGEITPNAILKPLFRTIRGKTSVRILDGETIVMGGMLQETRKTVNDKVPILGSLPFVGRVFQNNGISVEKRSILIFVNVQLVDPAGNPYRER